MPRPGNEGPRTIYALLELSTLGTAVSGYVGCCTDLRKRRSTHLSPSELQKRNRKACWLRELLERGCKPVVVALETCAAAESPEREAHWISLLRSWGLGMLNEQAPARRPGP